MENNLKKIENISISIVTDNKSTIYPEIMLKGKHIGHLLVIKDDNLLLLTITDFEIKNEYRGKGYASILLDTIINYLKVFSSDYTICLNAVSSTFNKSKGLIQEDLIKFYQKHSFIVIDEINESNSYMEYYKI